MPYYEFQSTLPAWGETEAQGRVAVRGLISIHSPRMGRDVLCFSAQLRTAAFQSTLPAWGETPKAAGSVQGGG